MGTVCSHYNIQHIRRKEFNTKLITINVFKLVTSLCVTTSGHSYARTNFNFYPDLAIPLLLFFLSTGLKCTVGMGQTSCIGFASTRQLSFLFHPAPSRNKPLIYTPSCNKSHEERWTKYSGSLSNMQEVLQPLQK